MSQTSQDAPKRRSNVALIVSLCFNFVLLGLIGMGVFRAVMFHSMMERGPWRGQLAPHMLMALAPDQAPKIHGVIAAHSGRITALRQAAMEARHDAMAAFAATDFTQQNFRQSLERMRTADAALEDEELKVVSESVGALTPNERRAIASSHHGFAMHHHGF